MNPITATAEEKHIWRLVRQTEFYNSLITWTNLTEMDCILLSSWLAGLKLDDDPALIKVPQRDGVPIKIAPLTQRGRRVLTYLQSMPREEAWMWAQSLSLYKDRVFFP